MSSDEVAARGGTMYTPNEIAADPMIVLEYVLDCGREPSHAEIAIDLIGFADGRAVDTIERAVAELAGELLVRVRGGLVAAYAPRSPTSSGRAIPRGPDGRPLGGVR